MPPTAFVIGNRLGHAIADGVRGAVVHAASDDLRSNLNEAGASIWMSHCLALSKVQRGKPSVSPAASDSL